MQKIWILFIVLTILRLAIFFWHLSEPFSKEKFLYQSRIYGINSVENTGINLRLGDYSSQLKLDSNLDLGKIVTLRGILVCYESFRCTRGRIDDADIISIRSDGVTVLFQLAGRMRGRIERVYFNSLRKDQARLLSGIVLGGTDLDRNFKDKIRIAGLSHVVAASGMNVTLVAGLMLAILKFIPLNRRILTTFAIVSIASYVLVAGLSPAIVRAGIMGLIVLIAGTGGRKTSSYYSLFLTGMLMLWVSPLLLVDFGFLLSFASMMGQLTLITQELKMPSILRFPAEILLQTLLAIGFTLPIVLVAFHSFSLISLVSNLLVVWTVEPLMILGLIAGIVGIAFSELANFLLIPAGILLNYFLWVVRVLSSEKFLFKFEGFNLFMAVGYYFILGSLLYYFKGHRSGSS